MRISGVAHAGNISFINSVLALSISSSKLITDSSPYPWSETEETGETNSRLGASSVSVVSVVSGKEGSRYRLTAVWISERWYPLAPTPYSHYRTSKVRYFSSYCRLSGGRYRADHIRNLRFSYCSRWPIKRRYLHREGQECLEIKITRPLLDQFQNITRNLLADKEIHA